jgi:hypothetical protein
MTVFELLSGHCKRHAHTGAPFDLIVKMAKIGKMVGTTRFELATSPTPRVRSTRLSHVPTFTACR